MKWMSVSLHLARPSFPCDGLVLIKACVVQHRQTAFLLCGEMCSITMATGQSRAPAVVIRISLSAHTLAQYAG